MLVAMAMMAVLVGSLYASLQIGFRARERADASLVAVRTAGIVQDILRQDLECAPPPRGVLAGPFVGQDAKGTAATNADADSVAFYTRAANTPDAAPGIILVEFAVAQLADDPEPAMVRRVTVNLLAPQTPEPIEEVLCRNVASLNLCYFDGSTWLDTWDSTTQGDALPAAVEVALELKRPAPRVGEQSTYRLRRVVLLPCYTAPSSGTTVVPPTSQR